MSFAVIDDLPPPSTPGGADGYDVVVSNLALAEAADGQSAFRQLHGLAKRGGRVVITLPLRGSWAEFLDLYGDVLAEQGKPEPLAALRAYQATSARP